MRERGIGRPSTYSKIIEGLIKHKYVVKNKWGGLVATALGRKVYEQLVSRFKELVSEETTRELEEKMSLIEMGKLDYQGVLRVLANQLDEMLREAGKVEVFSK
jgi:reverse gyrase